MTTRKNEAQPVDKMNRGAQLMYRWRYDKDLTQRKCSILFDCESTQLSKWENGAAKPGRRMAVIIERLTLGVVTCGSWDEDPLPDYEIDPVLKPTFDPALLPKE